MYYLKKFEQIVKSKNNKKQKIFILSASVISLVASGGSDDDPQPNDGGLVSIGDVTGNVSAGSDNIILGQNSGGSGTVDTGAGDDVVVGGDGVDFIRGGAGADNVQGGAGVDNFVLIGQTSNAGYSLSDLQNPNGTGIDLTGLLELVDVNNNAVSDATSGDVIDGGPQGAFLFIYGNVDLTGVTLINITRIDVHSEVSVPASTLKSMIDGGILKEIIGDNSTVLIITHDGAAIDIDLTGITMAGIDHITLGSNVTLIVDAADIADSTIIDGVGVLKAASGVLDLDGKSIATSIDIMDSNGNIITPVAESGSLGSQVLVAENTTIVGNFSVTDASSVGDVTYSLSGVDAAQFNIDASSGDISFKTAPNFEAPTDVGNDHIYDITVTATDEHGKSISQDIDVFMYDVNDAPTGSVTITGTALEDQTLVASNNIVDEDGLGSITYQWQRDGNDIGGATANLYTLVQADVGKTITAVANYTDGGTNSESVTSAATTAVLNNNHAPTGSVTIAGTPTEDQTLTASNNLADVDGLGSISYQWQRDGQDINGATNATYTLVQADVGKAITAVANYTDLQNSVESVASAATALVANVNDAPTGSVTIAGTTTEDETLTASNNIADEDGLGAITYQWQRDGNDINGATNATYTLVQADVGKAITAVASYTDGFSANETVTSAVTAFVANVNDAPTGSVTIIGTPAENQTLVASNNLADEDGLGSITYQWQRDGNDIGGATANLYTLVQADVGKAITAVASYTDGGSTAESVTSAATNLITNVNDAPTGSVSIAGTPTQGQTLTASNNIADADGLGVITYQWQRDGIDINGETNTTYSLVQADVGKAIKAVASYTDGGSTNESVTSAATANVANVNDAPTGSVTITGTAAEDEILTATNNIADEDGLGSITYQWLEFGLNINGATNSTFTLTQNEVGKAISVRATYTDGFSTVETVTSGVTALVANVNDRPTGSVTITGTPTEDQTLTATNNIADEDGLGTITYQWQRDGNDINGATNATYTLVQDDVGKAITAIANYTDQKNTNESVTSAATNLVTNVNDSPTGGITITGALEHGSILTASNNIVDEDGLGTLTYQWKSDGVDQADSDDSQYKLKSADVGKVISVEVTYTDTYLTAESVLSGNTGVVQGFSTFHINNNIDGVIVSEFYNSDLVGIDELSTSLSNLGDVNGDGFDDFAFGSGRSSLGSSYAGSVFVVFGNGSGFAPSTNLNSLTGANGYRIDGASSGDKIGYSISSAGDVNGDGFGDIIMGAADYSTGGPTNGAAYVVYGKATGHTATMSLASLNGTNGFRIDGEVPVKKFGYAVSSAGDVNNDGFDDVIIGAYQANFTNQPSSGASYVVFGQSASFGASINVNTLIGANGFRIQDGNFVELSGLSVSNLGDINGDGFDDMFIGAPSAASSSGYSYVVFGKSSGFSATMDLTTMTVSQGFRIFGTQANDYSGGTVSNAGDVNGDGLADMIIGAIGTDYNGDRSGSAYVVFGKTSGYTSTLSLYDLDGSDGFRIDGTGNLDPNIVVPGNDLGADVSSAGDINGDGFGDLIIGSNNGNYNGNQSGSFYVLYGKGTAFSANMLTEELDGTNGFRIDGPEANGKIGRMVSAAGDVNGDGFDDLLVGSTNIGTNGKGYIIYGGSHFAILPQTPSNGDDNLHGTDNADVTNGLDGADNIYGYAGSDTLNGGAGADKLKGGIDADTLNGGADIDTFVFAPGDSEITIGGAGNSGTVSGYDTIQDYTANTASTNSEIIDFVGIGSTVADTTGTDGTDSVLTVDGATIKSHSITNGIITFDDDDTFTTALDISSEGEIAAVLQYIQSQDLGDAGASVVFDTGNDNYLFIQGTGYGHDYEDVVVLLENTEFDSLINSAVFGSSDLLVV